MPSMVVMCQQVGETEADKGLKEYQAKNRMISCPTCGHGIEKITGCNRVTCAQTHLASQLSMSS